jgi:ribosomal protein S18 acetylase RimI-like enzyme
MVEPGRNPFGGGAPVHIRSATEEDLPGILEIERLSFPNRKRWDPDEVREAMKDLILLADEDGISGYLIACCREATGTGVILRVAVHPDRRNRGIATRLIEAALGIFSDRELQEAEIDVEIVKRGAIRVYENLGFRTVRGIPMSENDSMHNENGSIYIMKRDLRRAGGAG